MSRLLYVHVLGGRHGLACVPRATVLVACVAILYPWEDHRLRRHGTSLMGLGVQMQRLTYGYRIMRLDSAKKSYFTRYIYIYKFSSGVNSLSLLNQTCSL